MAHKHEADLPFPLEMLVTRLGDLEMVLGKHAAPVLGAIRETVLTAIAARDRGDVPGAIDHIGRAMDRLAGLADQLDPAEAGMMRAVAQSFRVALRRGDTTHAKETADVMLQKSGATERKES